MTETEDKSDGTAEIELQVSDAAQEGSQLTQSDTNQDIVSSSSHFSTVSTNCVVSTNVPASCSDDEHDVLQHIKSEEELPDVLNSICKVEFYDIDSPMYSPDVDNGLTFIKSERQLPHAKLEEEILPLDNTNREDTWNQNESETHVHMKFEKVYEDCGSYCGDTRHWVVCENGVLKEVKVEPTDGRPDTSEISTCIENFVEQQQLHNKNNYDLNLNPSNVRPYTCVTCGKSFKHSSCLTAHEKVHTDVKPYTCVTCEKSFKRSGDLTVHKRIHSNVKPYNCVMCEKSFKRSGDLTVHERIHTKVKPYMCVTCGKSFTHSSNLTDHERIHTNVRPYTCVTCGKSFRHPSNLHDHVKTHTDVKSFTCATCGKSFTQSGNLKTHEKIHTGMKPYSCSTCGKSFTQFCSLTVHELIHTNVRPFTCDTCGKSFKISGYLTKHKKNSHQGDSVHM